MHPGGHDAALTPAEQRVLVLLVETPDSYKVIAKSLGVSVQTIGTQAASVFRKLGYSSDGGVQPRIALILAHHEAVIRGLDRASLYSNRQRGLGQSRESDNLLASAAEPAEWR